MGTKEVTIIMPVYNGAAFLQRALNSVVDQSIGLDAWVLLAVNDGSTDNSLKILQSYHERYPDNILVIDQQNRGAARTRNESILKVETEWLTFLDQDDYYDRNHLETLLTYPHLTEVDLVICGIKRVLDDGTVLRSVSPPRQAVGFGRWSTGYAWNRLCRTSYLIEKNVCFFDSLYGEGIYFSYVSNLAAGSRIAILATKTYNWVLNRESVSQIHYRLLTPESHRGFVAMIKQMVVARRGYDPDVYADYFLLSIMVYCMFLPRSRSMRSFAAYSRAMFAAVAPAGPAVTKNPLIFRKVDGLPIIDQYLVAFAVVAHTLHVLKFFIPIMRMVQKTKWYQQH
ncbi:MAG: glycosyltransferase family 2 protein [Propionibacteriaceae bacterium]|nr:glycosyltransferase family 2 protein [Propionibacteriaceae bacterium]